MEIVFVIVAILIFGIFSGVEIVFTSGRFLNYKANDYNASTIKIAQKYSQEPTILLISCLLVKLFALGFMTVFAVDTIHDMAYSWYSMQWYTKILTISGLLLLVFAMILFEYLPKSLSRLYTEQIVPAFSFLVLQVFKLLHYPSVIIQNVSGFILKLSGIPAASLKIEYTALDIERLIQEHQGASDEEDIQVDTELFENVLFLKNMRVRECMVPRNEISAIEINESIDQLKEIIIRTYHSRILVYKDTIDNVVGYVHHFDLHKHPSGIADILIPIKVIPEAMTVQTLMNTLIADNKNIAWVINEYGGTAGVVTLEDVLEEIFGEIDDEYDDKEHVEKQLSRNEFILSGRLEIDRINEEYNLDIPEGEYETISGMIVNHTGTIPSKNEMIRIEKYLFKILNVSDTKIETVKLTVEDISNNAQ